MFRINDFKMFLFMCFSVVVLFNMHDGHRINIIYEKLQTINSHCMNNRPPLQLMPLYNEMVDRFLSEEMRRNSQHLIMYLDRVRELMKRTHLKLVNQLHYKELLNHNQQYVLVKPYIWMKTYISLNANMGKRKHMITERYFNEHHVVNTVKQTLIKTFFPRELSTFQVAIVVGMTTYVNYTGDDQSSFFQIKPISKSVKVRDGNWTECDRSKMLVFDTSKVCRVFDKYVIHSMSPTMTKQETELYVVNMINYTSAVIRNSNLDFYLPTLEKCRTDDTDVKTLESLQIQHVEKTVSMQKSQMTYTWNLPPESRVTLYCTGKSVEYFCLGDDRWITSFSMSRNHTIRDVKLPTTIVTKSSRIVVVMEFEKTLWMAPPNQTFSISPDCRATYDTHFEHMDLSLKFCRDFICTHNILVL